MPLEKKKPKKKQVKTKQKSKQTSTDMKQKQKININIKIGEGGKTLKQNELINKQSVIGLKKNLAKDKFISVGGKKIPKTLSQPIPIGDRSIPIDERKLNLIEPTIKRVGGTYSNITPLQYQVPPSLQQQKFELEKEIENKIVQIRKTEKKVDYINDIKNFFEEKGNPLTQTDINRLNRKKKDELKETRDNLLGLKPFVEELEKQPKEQPKEQKKIDTKKEQVETSQVIKPAETKTAQEKPNYFMNENKNNIPFLEKEKQYEKTNKEYIEDTNGSDSLDQGIPINYNKKKIIIKKKINKEKNINEDKNINEEKSISIPSSSSSTEDNISLNNLKTNFPSNSTNPNYFFNSPFDYQISTPSVTSTPSRVSNISIPSYFFKETKSNIPFLQAEKVLQPKAPSEKSISISSVPSDKSKTISSIPSDKSKTISSFSSIKGTDTIIDDENKSYTISDFSSSVPSTLEEVKVRNLIGSYDEVYSDFLDAMSEDLTDKDINELIRNLDYIIDKVNSDIALEREDLITADEENIEEKDKEIIRNNIKYLKMMLKSFTDLINRL